MTKVPTLDLVSKMTAFYVTAEQKARDETIDWLVGEYLQYLDDDVEGREHFDKTVMYVFGKNSAIYEAYRGLVEQA